MTDFKLDTSGYVPVPLSPESDNAECVVWQSLSPFAQGYMEAAAEALYDALIVQGWSPEAAASAVAFSNWAPETLARIMEDCAKAADLRSVPFGHVYNPNSAGGLCFWADRQAGCMRPFPPLTISLNNDGNVIFT